MMKKEAVLVVSFGTSHKATREKTIEAIERQIREEFPLHEVRRAFTSGMIMKVLKQRDGIHVDNVSQAMEKLAADGYKQVIVQPTHVINGEEYDKMKAQAMAFENSFAHVSIGKPLLSESDDYEKVCRAVMNHFPQLEKDEALILMGHGTEHAADAAYAAVAYRFRAMGCDNVFMGTVEGYPELSDILPLIKECGPKKVLLQPFMVVAGDHAVNDMAGEDEDSWKSILEREGYQVECILKGLGELPEIRNIYMEHVKRAMGK